MNRPGGRLRSSVGRGEEGFTLVELTISTLLLLLGLALATQMLLESQRLLIRTAVENTRPSTSLLLTLLRRDVQHAVSASRGPEGGLVLEFPDRSQSRYRLESGCLGRSEAPRGEDFGATRCLHPGVQAWSWQRPSGRRVDFVITLREIDIGRGAQLISDLRLRPARPDTEVLTLSAAMRASGPRRGRW